MTLAYCDTTAADPSARFFRAKLGIAPPETEAVEDDSAGDVAADEVGLQAPPGAALTYAQLGPLRTSYVQGVAATVGAGAPLPAGRLGEISTISALISLYGKQIASSEATMAATPPSMVAIGRLSLTDSHGAAVSTGEPVMASQYGGWRRRTAAVMSTAVHDLVCEAVLAGSSSPLSWRLSTHRRRRPLVAVECKGFNGAPVDVRATLSLDSYAYAPIFGARPSIVREQATVVSDIERRLRALDLDEAVDPEALSTAHCAIDNAVTAMTQTPVEPRPVVAIADDGILSLQWRAGRQGVLVVFPGDGKGNVSVKGPGSFYAMNGQEFDPAHGLPQDALDAIAGLPR